MISIATELNISLRAVLLTIPWIYIDYQWFKKVGTSPIFGALKEKNIEEKIRNFTFSISFHLLIFGLTVFLYYKLTSTSTENVSLKYLFGLICSLAILINIILRIYLTIAYKKALENIRKILITTIIVTSFFSALLGFVLFFLQGGTTF